MINILYLLGCQELDPARVFLSSPTQFPSLLLLTSHVAFISTGPIIPSIVFLVAKGEPLCLPHQWKTCLDPTQRSGNDQKDSSDSTPLRGRITMFHCGRPLLPIWPSQKLLAALCISAFPLLLEKTELQASENRLISEIIRNRSQLQQINSEGYLKAEDFDMENMPPGFP